ncbi:receptor-like protein 9DC1 [Rhodamnia argentea]|uniref:Receptor-like protein 9DC1 n=1 Tax=Rhodamnia argentea TaxID=178133 RepID=A0ABM3HMV0_9MYRT|nr:receptor-like protein 9DC1 [Rhodamnia argentea]
MADSPPPSQHPLCSDHEKLALLRFKQSFAIEISDSCDFSRVESWGSEDESGDCCSWGGIRCDKDADHVVGLDLSYSCLHGSPSPNSTLFSLVHLQELSLAKNHFNFFEIPSSFSRLTKLKYLNLSKSFFAGQVPLEISMLSDLGSLDLSVDNVSSFDHPSELSGPGFGNLVQNLSGVQELHLDSGLHGDLPERICHLPNLQFLDAGYQQDLAGHFPEFPSGSLLRSLRLTGTSLSGQLPSLIGSLNLLGLGFCRLRGCIPPWLMNMTYLTGLQLLYNDLEGSIPTSLSRLVKLRLGSMLPTCLGNISGSLSILNLRSNNFHCPIPRNWTNTRSLNMVNLSQNRLKGEVPRSLASCDMLEFLDLRDNLVNDMQQSLLPTTVPIYTYYGDYDYYLSINNKGMQMVCMKILDVLMAVDLSTNQFEGEIPENIGNLKGLHALNLSHNVLTGPRGGQFDTFLNTSYLENSGLCGSPLSNDCGDSASLPPSEEDEDSGFLLGLSWQAVVIGYGWTSYWPRL